MDEEILKRLPTMDRQAYEAWSELHRRFVRGEPMSAVEAARYEAGCWEIDSTVCYDGDTARQQEIEARLDAVEAELRKQREMGNELDARIATLVRELAEDAVPSSAGGN